MHALLALSEEPEVEVGCGVLSPGGGGGWVGDSADLPYRTSSGEAGLFLSSTEQSLAAHPSLWAVEGQLGAGGAGKLPQSSREGPRPNLG